MLLALSLRDFVIVDELSLSFQNGFTVLTGETGAGKSITLDALGLLLGDKADFSQVRQGAKEAQLSALFDLSDAPAALALLRGQSLLHDDETELSLRRIIDAKGRSRNFINHQAATLAQLKAVGGLLIDIHGQNAHHALNSEAAQRDLLDAFAGAQEEAAAVREAYHAWQQARQDLQAAEERAETLAIERERLQWQLGELDALAAQPGEWENLSQSHDALAHAADIVQAAEEVGECIDGENGLQSRIYRSRNLLSNLLNAAPQFAESITLLDAVEAELAEVSANMRDTAARVEMDENLLAQQAQRLQELLGAARKYRVEPADLPAKRNEIEQALNELAAAADLDALRAQVAEQEQRYMAAAQRLSVSRRSAAQRLSEETTEHMQHLSMAGARFQIALSAASPSVHGLEQIQFQVAANKGTALRPLNKVASGGELARISLALQMVTGQYHAVPTLIFDEVDSGIGGAVADVVGHALRSLGRDRQVLAVTHLPQVAVCGEQHWQVSKGDENGRTVSRIRILQGDERVAEIARMLGGETVTDTTRRHAAELLELAARS